MNEERSIKDEVVVVMPRELAEWWAGYHIEDVIMDRLMTDTHKVCREACPYAPTRPKMVPRSK